MKFNRAFTLTAAIVCLLVGMANAAVTSVTINPHATQDIHMRILIVFFALSVSSVAATWHIRPDGGQPVDAFGSVQTNYCDGHSDAPATGHSTTDHACALGDFRWLYATRAYNTRRWLIAGGDTVILHDASGTTPLRVSGYNGPNSGDYWGDYPGIPSSEGSESIPSGTAGAHTRILGENYANCTTKTKVFSGYASGSSFRLSGSQYVDVQCIEMTDHLGCGRLGISNQCNSSFPLDDFSYHGIVFSNTTQNIYLQDLDIHGFAHAGIFGPIGGDVHLTNVRIGFNVGTGWDLDDGTASTGGTAYLSNTTIEWSGCIEEYPITHSIPALICFDQGSGNVIADGIGTPNGDGASWNIDRSTFRYNTQDGADILHSSVGAFSITNSYFYGNMGQAVKIGDSANSILRNNLIYTNCGRIINGQTVTGAPAGFNSNLTTLCRAGDSLAIGWGGAGTNFEMDHNTIISGSATTFDIFCNNATTCNAGTKAMRDNIVIGYATTTYNAAQLPGSFCYNDCNGTTNPSNDAMWTTRSNNVFYNMRSCPSPLHTNENCSSPVITTQPTTPFANWTAFDISAFNLNLPSGSPSIGAGVAITGQTTDYNAYPYATPPSIGALEFGSGTPATPVAPAPFLF